MYARWERWDHWRRKKAVARDGDDFVVLRERSGGVEDGEVDEDDVEGKGGR